MSKMYYFNKELGTSVVKASREYAYEAEELVNKCDELMNKAIHEYMDEETLGTESSEQLEITRCAFAMYHELKSVIDKSNLLIKYMAECEEQQMTYSEKILDELNDLKDSIRNKKY